MQNEKLSAQGEQQMERLQMQEAARIQGISISEGQRLQNAEAQGEQFMFSTREGRQMQQMNRAAGMADRYAQQEMQSGINATAAMSGAVSALGSLAGSAMGANAARDVAEMQFGQEASPSFQFGTPEFSSLDIPSYDLGIGGNISGLSKN
jgi:hypothetical protein